MALPNKTQSGHRFLSPGVIFLYAFSNLGLLLLGNHPFWDDWIVVDLPWWQILDTFKQAGSFLNIWGYLHVSMLAIGPWLYRFASLILFYGISYHFYSILKRTAILDEEQSFAAALICLFLPLNLGRGALILFPYVFCLYIFMLAWSLLPRNRNISFLLFFLSFNINSLLVFYLLPLLEGLSIFFHRLPAGPPLTARKILSLLKIYILGEPIFILLPIIYYSIKLLFFRPYGLYSGYNEHYSILSLIKSPFLQFGELLYSVSKLDLPATLCLFFIFFVLLIVVPRSKLGWKALRIPAISIFVIYLGVLPYHILGLVPTFTGWSSRHQLLMPFGISILIAYCIYQVPKTINSRSLLRLVLLACIFASSVNSFSFYADSRKQQSVQRFMAGALRADSPRLVVIVDKTNNALRRTYRFYEINGMLARATGDQSFFGIQSSDINSYLNGKLDKYFTGYYLASSHRRDDNSKATFIILNSSFPWKYFFPSSSHACIVVSPASDVKSVIDRTPCSSLDLIELK